MSNRIAEGLCETNYPLKDVQKIELNILKKIHSVCEKLDIKYVITSGTLLGAIRHKGFIPWDDDIDIVMPREDYEIFLQKGQDLLPPNLFIQHYTTEPNNNNLYIKVRDRNTLFIEENNENFEICHGIFVDVFPMDKVPADPKLQRTEARKRRLFDMISGCYSKAYISSICNPFKRLIGWCIRFFICRRQTIQHLMFREDTRRKRLNNEGDDCYFVNFFWLLGIVSYKDYFDSVLYEFEGEKFYGPRNYDRILTMFYGDYMVIPPKEKQITHKPKKVDLHFS